MNKKMKKTLALIAALALFFAIGIGGTLAYLNAITPEVINTFTMGNIKITLTETDVKEYKLTPGLTTNKDPKVTVEANSEKCYLFIEAIESKDLTTFLEYKISGSNGWTALDNVPGVYFQVVDQSKSQKEIEVLEGNQVKTKAETTKIPANPTLTFKAYAIQFDGIDDASTAWEQVYKIASPKSPTGSETS